MKKFLSVTLLFIVFNAHSQQLKKYPVAKTGCSVYMFCDPGNFETSYSEDSSKVITGECIKDGFSYGLIYVQLKEIIHSKEDAEGLLESYLNFLKGQFTIREAAGYGKGMHLKEREDIIGMIDYWQSEDNQHWSIQGWTDGKILTVLYVKGSEQADYNKQQLFFKGFLFPGM
ncbi:MAG: hypothetical protein HYX40_07900 [Sphingobacteriales bacterium]|nr:hypothetical protein [Sphingobacteriales bacterium]